MRVHFTDFFEVDPDALEAYGAFNISLINDLPLFIDPFLLFNSEKEEYQALHDGIITYLRFLRDHSEGGPIRPGLLRAWYRFPEVKQNWFGYSLVGNEGSGLGAGFAASLWENLGSVFANFGDEEVTRGSHLEKLCLIESGVGRDNISDFTTNLIKQYLLEYTQAFALEHIEARFRDTFTVEKVSFNYETQSWMSRTYELPSIGDDFVLLTPKDILTKDEGWINKQDLYGDFENVLVSLPNEQLRAQLSNYLFRVLPEEPTKKQEHEAILEAIREFPQFIEHYIRFKEDRGDLARALSDQRVAEVQSLFVEQLQNFVQLLEHEGFYAEPGDTKQEALRRVAYLKDNIENKGGWRIFFVNGAPVRRESDVHILFRLTWYGTPSDVSREVDDGRGPADFKVSRGRLDKTILEFKLAKNTHLRANLQKQVEIYQKASDAQAGLRVILYFTDDELTRVQGILEELGLTGHPDVILIDARPKRSASKA
ncbi:hypothetical protein WI460_11545 [Gemmatimonadota bacterium Y43]|uniref:hypothetical protein n=1 Tax=Gaopeijia maritima TaxID=3119007 RepID=UPI003269B321